jgi:hypothetical protein
MVAFGEKSETLHVFFEEKPKTGESLYSRPDDKHGRG